MKIALQKDMPKVRAEARLQMQQLSESAMQISSQDLVYLRKEQNARAFLDGVAVTPSQLVDEADLRGIPIEQLAISIVSKAQKAGQKREAIETLRIKYSLALERADTQCATIAVVSAFAEELQTLNTQ